MSSSKEIEAIADQAVRDVLAERRGDVGPHVLDQVEEFGPVQYEQLRHRLLEKMRSENQMLLIGLRACYRAAFGDGDRRDALRFFAEHPDMEPKER